MLPRPTSHSTALGPGAAGPSLAIPSSVTWDKPQGCNAQIPTSGAQPFMVEPAALGKQGAGTRQHTQMPYVTGTSVLGITYKDGVILASDTLGSYGSTKRYKSVDRIRKVNDFTVLGASGELSDFNYITKLLDQKTTEDYVADDDVKLTTKEIHSYLRLVLYNRRNKFDPLWNTLVVGGLDNGKPFLGSLSMIGVSYSDQHIATGFGNALARPLFRERHRPDMTEEEALELLYDGLKVCYYRDKQSINKFVTAKVTKEGVSISEPFALETNWDYKHFVDPSLNAVGVW